MLVDLQKKLPIVMLTLLILASVIEVLSEYYASPEVKTIVIYGHLILAILVFLIGLVLLYARIQQKKKNSR
jgi:uncharacterized BrkB/YihY/UPF0761 family membrane protein